MRRRQQPHWKQQRGAATLVIVMVLFLIMAMVAAYANRNLVFEQRIASNYYRSTLALDTAEAGVEWALSALNGGFIDSSCKADSAAGSGFRERYTSIDTGRSITVARSTKPVAVCVSTSTKGWVCQCPLDGVPSTPVVDGASGMQPLFSIALAGGSRAGVMQLNVVSCTDIGSGWTYSDTKTTPCADSGTAARTGLSTATVKLQAALVSALKTPPATPLTARGNVDLGATGLGLHNAETSSSGLLMQIGGSYSGSTARMSSLPGTPVAQGLISGDASLLAGDGAHMFALFFGMAPATYQNQPATRSVKCEGDCSSALQAAYGAGYRLLWIEGDATISSNISLGTAADPFVLVVNGALTLSSPMLLSGAVYARGDVSWAPGVGGQPARLTGALLSEGNVSVVGAADVIYDKALITVLNNQRGSFVRVPGSWTDVVQ